MHVICDASIINCVCVALFLQVSTTRAFYFSLPMAQQQVWLSFLMVRFTATRAPAYHASTWMGEYPVLWVFLHTSYGGKMLPFPT